MSAAQPPPPPLLTPSQQEHMVRDGYLLLPSVLSGPELAALQRECSRVEAVDRPDWERHVAAGTLPARHNGSSADGYGPTHHVILPVMARHDIFPELLAHHTIVGALHQFMGPNIVNSDNGLCIKPAGTETHVGWHRDSTQWDVPEAEIAEQWTPADRAAWEAVRAPCCDRPFNKIKAFIFVHDVDETTGPFAVLPGSHRMDQGRTFRDSSGVERTAGTEIQARAAGERGDDPSEAMPGHVKFVGRAGDVLLWNGALFHAAMHNTDDKPRVVLLYNFVQASSGVIAQRTPEFRTGRSVDELARWLPSLSPQFFGAGGTDGDRRQAAHRLRDTVAQLMTGSSANGGVGSNSCM